MSPSPSKPDNDGKTKGPKRPTTVPASCIRQRPLEHSLDAYIKDGHDPIVARMLAVRGISADHAESYFERSLGALPDPMLIPDMDKAARRLATAIEKNQHVLVHGDYDVDGCASSAILTGLCRFFRNQRCHVFIPDRILDGYGLTESSYDGAMERQPDLFITVDCGTIDKGIAKRIRDDVGADVIITDHHMPAGDERPDALAVCNPVLPENPHRDRNKDLCGAGVAWCLALQTTRYMCGSRIVPPTAQKMLFDLLQIAAVATIADVMKIQGANRSIVHHGLKAIQSDPIPGIAYLSKGLELRSVDERAIGWRIGPVLNASGRIESALRSYRILAYHPDWDYEQSILKDVTEGIDANRQRQEMTEKATEEALAIAHIEHARNPEGALVVAGPWHPGIVGIVAGRLVEHANRPAFVFSEMDDDGCRKGSGRSIDGFPLGEAVIQAVKNGILVKGGGHPKAAGATVKDTNLQAFRDHLDVVMKTHFPDGAGPGITWYDQDLPLSSMHEDMARLCQQFRPFGHANPEPVFKISGRIQTMKPMKPDSPHAKGTIVPSTGRSEPREFVWFYYDKQCGPGDYINALVTLDLNTWRDETKPVIKIDKIIESDTI
jgi:single-stranded-DNA-specific exonuclease